MKYINQIVFLLSLFITCLSHAMWTPLHEAAEYGNLEEMQNLLNTGADANVANKNGETPLHIAAGKGHEAIARLLLERNAAVDPTTTRDTWTPLHLAATYGHEPLVYLLLKKGANRNAVDQHGETPLYYAAIGSGIRLYIGASGGHMRIIKLLHRWPLHKKRQEQMFAFLMAAHPRLGADSSARILSKELFKHIWEFVKPTIEEIDHFRGDNEAQSNRTWLNNTWLQRGAVTTAIAGLSILGYHLFKRR